MLLLHYYVKDMVRNNEFELAENEVTLEADLVSKSKLSQNAQPQEPHISKTPKKRK